MFISELLHCGEAIVQKSGTIYKTFNQLQVWSGVYLDCTCNDGSIVPEVWLLEYNRPCSSRFYLDTTHRHIHSLVKIGFGVVLPLHIRLIFQRVRLAGAIRCGKTKLTVLLSCKHLYVAILSAVCSSTAWERASEWTKIRCDTFNRSQATVWHGCSEGVASVAGITSF